jgi:hypothetical protein
MKTKLEKHMEELREMTSGGAHDAVTFSGKGLSFLKDLFKSSKKAKKDDMYMEEDEDELEENEEEDEDEEETYRKKTKKSARKKEMRLEDDEDEYEDEDEDEEEEYRKKRRKTKKNTMGNYKEANGGVWEEEDEDPEDPAEDDDSIIQNKGKRIPKKKIRSAVSKNAYFDEERFAKSFNEYEEVFDASPALNELAKSVRSLGKSANATQEMIEELQEQNMILAKAVQQLLKSNAALAADLEVIKKQPVTTPATGFLGLSKKQGDGQMKRLSKSEIEDVLNEAMLAGEIEPERVARLGSIRSEAELRHFVENLPAAVRERL